MANSNDESEYGKIIDYISECLDGASTSEVFREILLARRTIQRRLAELVASDQLIAVGRGRGCRYYLPEKAPLSAPAQNVQKGIFSAESKKIRSRIQLPLAQRTPVGYSKSFLDSYRPNESFYLPEPMRRRLEELGQVESGDLPAGTYLRKIMHRLLIDLSWNSSRLEGNTYSLLETQRLLDFGENAQGKAAQETQMILNHKAAIEMLSDQAEQIGFNRYTICNLHALLSDNLLPDPAAGGKLRARPVGIGGTVFHPLEVPQQIEEQFDLILSKAREIKDPFEQGFFAMVHLPYLQAFEDVNKRVSRLAANIPLIRHNLCPLSFIDVDPKDYIDGVIAIYELNRVDVLRDVFFWAYQRSCAKYAAIRQSLGDPDPFRMKYREEMGRQVREIVRRGMDRLAAAQWVSDESRKNVPEADQKRLTEVVLLELDSMHEGNIARYRILPSEYHSWKGQWK